MAEGAALSAAPPAAVVWDESLSVGHEGIDQEHRQLVAIIQTLEDAMAAGQGGEAIGPILCDLCDYAAAHFANEEQVMKATHFPEMESHRRQHSGMLETLTQLVYHYETGRHGVAQETLGFLRRWFFSHVVSADGRMAAYLHQLPPDAIPKWRPAGGRI